MVTRPASSFPVRANAVVSQPPAWPRNPGRPAIAAQARWASENGPRMGGSTVQTIHLMNTGLALSEPHGHHEGEDAELGCPLEEAVQHHSGGQRRDDVALHRSVDGRDPYARPG